MKYLCLLIKYIFDKLFPLLERNLGFFMVFTSVMSCSILAGVAYGVFGPVPNEGFGFAWASALLLIISAGIRYLFISTEFE